MGEPSDAVGDPVEAIRSRDELLQVLYWMRGEGLGVDVTPGSLVAFLQGPEPTIAVWLRQLAAQGYAEVRASADGEEAFRLTPLGLEEGRRRFLDEFAPVLGQHGHGECSRPECACHEAATAEATCWTQDPPSGS